MGEKNDAKSSKNECVGMVKNKNTMMRVDKELLKELSKAKLVKAESYASVVKRLIDKERKLK